LTQKLYEAFRWFRDDFKTTSQIGSKIRIKGVALFPTVSRNNREYIEEELLRSARTLAGKPIDVNHEYDRWLASEQRGVEPSFKGHVLDADYEDGYIEYVAEVNSSEYVAKLKDRDLVKNGQRTEQWYMEKWGKKPIHGVSISANYRYNENDATEQKTPLGIQFVRLSLVEDPELPGVKGTTIELMETIREKSSQEVLITGLFLRDFAPKVYETYNKDVLSKMTTEQERGNYSIEPVFQIAHDPRKYDDALEVGAVQEAEEPADIGEPMGDYTSFADCVAKNQDKDDPEAYCGSIKHKVEGETEEEPPVEESVPAFTPLDIKAESLKPLEPIKIPSFKEQNKTIDEKENLQTKLAEEKAIFEQQQKDKIHEAEHSAMKNDINELKTDVNSMKEMLKQIYEFTSEHRTAITETRGIISNIPNEFTKHAEKIWAEITKLGTDFASYQEGANKYGVKLVKMTEDMDELKANSAMKSDLNNISDKIDSLKETVDGREEKLASIDALNEKTDSMTETVAGYEDRIKALETPPEPEEPQEPITETVDELEILKEKLENLETHVKAGFKAPEKSLTETDNKPVVDLSKDPLKG